MDQTTNRLVDQIQARYATEHDYDSDDIEILQDGYKQADEDRGDLLALVADLRDELVQAETERDAARQHAADVEDDCIRLQGDLDEMHDELNAARESGADQ